MNDRDTFDWSSLGDEPLPGEMDDDALLQAVFAAAEAPPVGAPEQPPAPRWIRPVVAAVVLLAAAVVLVIFAPAWTEALMGAADDGSIAPDVETTDDEDEATRMHAQSHAQPRAVVPETKPAPSLEAPPEEEVPEEEEALAEPSPAQDELPQRPKATRRDPPPSADAMLREAQDAMAAKDSAGAIRKYDALLRRHPGSAQARAARVSLGRLELNAGHAKKALAHYDAYLRGPGGAMRREAELGRIDALRKLGRADAEKQAIEAFLGDHPSTVHATRLRSRLEAL